MASITIRNLDDALKQRLRVVAATHGHSMEEEVRSILQCALARPAEAGRLGSRIHKRFASLGGVELEVPERHDRPRTVDFDD